MKKIPFVWIAALVFAGLTFCFAGCGVNADRPENGKELTGVSTIKTQPIQELSGDLTAHFVAEATQPPELYSQGSFIDEQHAWVAASFEVKRTSDGGRTWQLMRPSAESEPAFGKMGHIYHLPYFISPERGWLKGSKGTWQTEDGGTTWRQVFTDHTGNPSFADEKHGRIATYTEQYQQNHVTKDGGQTWQPCGPKHRLNQQTPNKAFFLTPQKGWAITSYTDDERRTIYGVAHTTDGGCSWRQLWTEVQDQTYCGIYFLNEREGWLAGCYATGRLVQTKDGGKTWNRVQTPIEPWRSAPVDVYFANSKKGWIITRAAMDGNPEGMYRTNDGGQTWQQLTKDEIQAGVGTDDGRSEIPTGWKAGKLFQMLYANR